MTTLFPTDRRPLALARLLVAGLLLAALVSAGCAAPDYERIFKESLAQEALNCMHPRGVFQSAGDFKDDGDGVYSGTIYWKGAALENEHSTRVRFKVEEGVAKIYLVEDSAILPAAHQTCEIPLASGG
jgi:hypothetical protein